MDSQSIAIVSLACRFPNAASPTALWENVLAGRRSFREIPPTRLDLADYQAAVLEECDSITPVMAGLLTDWQFNRERFRIPSAAYAASDMVHWLALEVAAEAIDGAGGSDSIGRDRVAVIVGNTLTGEFSRANSLRYRAPYLQKVLAKALKDENLEFVSQKRLLARFSDEFKEAFPPPNEETLSGSLANTIAGRISNFFDFQGGAWTVDGACASSLIAVYDACSLLSSNTVDTAIVGAVDLSLDPFELVGFSRNGALTRDVMRVFDKHSNGFWPGEGCGFIVLKRLEEARRSGQEIHAVIRGWAVSTDGRGGLTRPSEDGQFRALTAAYERAGIDPLDIGYIEAHGTGTAVGDPVEVSAIARLRKASDASLPIGSIKANFGHTKAAAGMAGLSKTVLAMRNGVIPPHVGCEEPHPIFEETGNLVHPTLEPDDWRKASRRVAGVSGFGFGGVNAHIVLEDVQSPIRSRKAIPRQERLDFELFAFAADTRDTLVTQVEDFARRAASLSLSEMPEAASSLATKTRGHGVLRGAVVAKRPRELCHQLTHLAASIRRGEQCLEPDKDCFWGEFNQQPNIVFLFPGQGVSVPKSDRDWGSPLALGEEHCCGAFLEALRGSADTRHVQPAVAVTSLFTAKLLGAIGVEASTAVGHSLGELTALSWAGAIPESDLSDIAAKRGAVMSDYGRLEGGMLRLEADASTSRQIIAGLDLVVACENSAFETVVAGPIASLNEATNRSKRAGVNAFRLNVSHAFHSPMMTSARMPFSNCLREFEFQPLARAIVSTVTGSWLGENDNIADLLLAQLEAPVLFDRALKAASGRADLFIEVGPGQTLTRLAKQSGYRATSTEAFGPSMSQFFRAVGIAWSLGAEIELEALFSERSLRPIDLKHTPIFLKNPCGRELQTPETHKDRPVVSNAISRTISPAAQVEENPAGNVEQTDVESVVYRAVEQTTGLPRSAFTKDSRFLDDLHLNSLSVARIVSEIASELGLNPPAALTDFANASLIELVEAIIEIGKLGPQAKPQLVLGAAPWIVPYGFEWKTAETSRGHTLGSWGTYANSNEFQPPKHLTQLLNAGETSGVLLWLKPDFCEADLSNFWSVFKELTSNSGVQQVCVLHFGAPVAAFMRSLMLEGHFETGAVIELPDGQTDLEALSFAIGSVSSGFKELRITGEGKVQEAVFAPRVPEGDEEVLLGADDVVLVTGGARGIGAECAIRLALKTGAGLLLLGRSDRENQEVSKTLDRCKLLGLRTHYCPCDVTIEQDVVRAVIEGEARLGKISAILHAAGINRPANFNELSYEDLRETLAPKCDALKNCLAAIDPSHLRQIITFGSIIGKLGLAGEAHYALANEALARFSAKLGKELSDVRINCLEWSVWDGVGMGERLGTLERLSADGVTALGLDEALDAFDCFALEGRLEEPIAAITGRFGQPSTVWLDPPPLPLNRFIQHPVLYYPGVELVCDCEVSSGTDLYLNDHVIDGLLVLPAVFSLEAMTQVAKGLVPDLVTTNIGAIDFRKAVSVPSDGAITLRVAVLKTGNRIEAVLRASDDDFTTVRVRVEFSTAKEAQELESAGETRPIERLVKSIDATPFYESLFFQKGRFSCVCDYQHLSARRILASLDANRSSEIGDWFGQYFSSNLHLGDPGIRDSCLHALQAAIPHKRVIPVSVDQINFSEASSKGAVVEAFEVSSDENEFVFDIIVRDVNGQIVETWQKAKFRAVSDLPTDDLPPSLSAVWLERVLGDAIGCPDLRLAIEHGADRAQRREQVLEQLGVALLPARSDGRPQLAEMPSEMTVSLAHGRDITVGVFGPNAVACDVEDTTSDDIEGLSDRLAPVDRALAELIVQSAAEPIEISALRIWCARECLRKAGRPPEFGLELVKTNEKGMVLLSMGRMSIATKRAGNRIFAALTDRSANDVGVSTSRRANDLESVS
ncbi:MAG: SDR family NAD(P)-dependent oxidoreductase [Rhodobacteraceae bacterium]|nr:SDR family NAD(P)-dependent oxidoreductase [Paracoccaceae bacterium]